MKTKLLIISLLFCLNSFGQKLPINGLCLSDIVAVTGGHSLSEAFSNANPAYFDPAYAVAGGDWMSEFKNYGPPEECTRPTNSMYGVNWYYVVGGVSVTSANYCTVVRYTDFPSGNSHYAGMEHHVSYPYNDAYLGAGTDCTKFPDGYYRGFYYETIGGVSTLSSSGIRVTDGKYYSCP